MKISKMIAGCLLVLGVAGCTTMDSVDRDPLSYGISKGFNARYEQTTTAAMKALSSLHVTIASASEDDQGTIYMISKPVSALSWGEVGRVFVRKSFGPPTVVYVNWKQRSRMQVEGVEAEEFSADLFSAISKGL